MKQEELLKMIRPVSPKHCDLCGAKYKDEDYRLTGEKNGQTSVSISCQNCGNTYMLNVFSPAMGILGSSRSKLSLDVKGAEEISKFSQLPAISSDEALDAYNLFSSEEDNFTQAIRTLSRLKRTA